MVKVEIKYTKSSEKVGIAPSKSRLINNTPIMLIACSKFKYSSYLMHKSQCIFLFLLLSILCSNRISWYEPCDVATFFIHNLRFYIYFEILKGKKGVRRGNKIIATQKKLRSSKKERNKKKSITRARKLEKGRQAQSKICATNFNTENFFNIKKTVLLFIFMFSTRDFLLCLRRWCLRRKCHNTNRSILSFFSSLLLISSPEKKIWCENVKTAQLISNRPPKKKLFLIYGMDRKIWVIAIFVSSYFFVSFVIYFN